MTDTASLVIRIDSIEAELANRRLNTLNGTGNSIIKTLGGMATAYAAINFAKGAIEAADSFANLRAQLRLVSDSTAQASKTFDDLFQVAQDTKSSVESTVNLYARMARATDSLGISQEQLIGITKTINQTFQVSGSMAQEAASATLQLAQGMAAGALQGQELQAVLENSPRLAKLIADGMRIEVGELKKVAAEGKITTEEIVMAAQKGAQQIQREFGVLPQTVGGAMQQLRNDMDQMFSKTDTGPVVDAITELRTVITDPKFQESVSTLTTALIKVFTMGASAGASTINFFQDLGESVARAVGGIDLGNAEEVNKLIQERAKVIEILQNSVDNKENGGFFDKFFGVLDPAAKKQLEDRVALLDQMIGQAKSIGTSTNIDLDQALANAPWNEKQASSPALLNAGPAGPSKEQEDAAKALQKRIEGLNQEAAILGMTEEERDLYIAGINGATEAQLAEISIAYKRIDAYNAEQEAIRVNVQQMQAKEDLERRMSEEKRARHEQELGILIQSLQTEEEKINDSYVRRLQMIQGNTEAGSALQTELLTRAAEDRNAKIKALEDAQAMQTLGAYGQLFDGLSGIAKVYAGEQSGVYKGLFAISKAFNIAQATMSIASGAAKAYELGFPAGLIAGAQVLAQGAGLLSQIQGSQFSGAYDAGGSIPAGMVGLVGERGPELISGPANVTSRNQTADMLGGGKSPVNVQVVNLINVDELAEAMGKSQAFDKVVLNVVNLNKAGGE